MDTSPDFLNQIWGFILLLIIMGGAWLAYTILVIKRTHERQRRREEGLPPLPGIFDEVAIFIEKKDLAKYIPDWDFLPATQQRSLQTAAASNSNSTAAMMSMDDVPLPEPDDLLSPIDDIFSAPIPQKAPPASAAAKPQEIAPEPPPSPAEPEAPFAEPLEEPPQSPYLNYVPGSNELPPDSVEIMRVWRDVSDGTLIAGIRDQLFATNGEMDDQLKQRFTAIVGELMRVANISLQSPKSAVPTLPIVQEAAAKKEPEEPTGIAGQIEAILQRKLALMPQLKGRGIHVMPAASGGLTITVDGQTFEAVGDVTDPQVRDVIRQSVEEWEETQ